MEKKIVTQQNNQNGFESLKTLRVLVSKNEISVMLGSLQKARQALENISNVVRTNMMERKFKEEKESVKTTAEEKPVVAETTAPSVDKREYSTRNFDKSGEDAERRNTGDRATFDNNKSYAPRPPRDRQFSEDRPFDRNSRPAYTPGNRPPYTPGNRPPYTPGNRPPYTPGNRPAYTPDNRPGFLNTGDRTRTDKPFGDRKFTPRTPGDRPAYKGPKPETSSLETLVKKPERNFTNKQKKDKVYNESDKKELNKKAKIKMGYIVEDFGDGEDEERIGRVRSKKRKEIKVTEKKKFEKATITTDNLTVKILSEKIGRPVTELVKKCMLLGLKLNINSSIDFETAELVASEFGIELEKKLEKTNEEILLEEFEKPNVNEKPRPPIVTVMGHVDHGKTSLLDSIRQTNVIAGESGGITQHIGAYSIEVKGNKITFIDTPGHEAFASMRQRGAMVTDIAILVVAADDGIMPQTVEAIKYIKQAGVPMIVAINKIDKQEANPDRIKQQLTEHEVVPEEWGGDAICVPISAVTKKGIDKLLETILLVAEVSDLKADSGRKGFGTVIESKVDKGRGIVATVIVKNGTLKVGDYILCGLTSGRVRGMVDCKGKAVTSAGPSVAVSIIGLNDVPEAGDLMYVTEERAAKSIIEERLQKIAQEKTKVKSTTSLEDFLATNISDQKKKVYVLVKADVQGSSEAIRQTLSKLKNEEVVVECILSGAGIVTETDVLLAQASNATIIAFNTKIDSKAKQIAEKNGVTIKEYKIIYDAVDYVTEKINAMLTPVYEERPTGKAEVRKVFKITNVGAVAGCYVIEGTVSRSDNARVIRGQDIIIDAAIESIKVQKDETKQVGVGFECGIRIKGFSDFKEKDIIQSYELIQVKRGKSNE